MAGRATLRLHGRVLENERPVLVDVALEANGILRAGSPHLLGPSGRGGCGNRCTARILRSRDGGRAWQTAVSAANGSCSKARAAPSPGVLPWSARDAGNGRRCSSLRSGGAGSLWLHVLDRRGMAGQAAVVNFLGGMVGENEYLRFVAAAGNVGRPGPMAPLAPLMGRAALGIQGRFPVRSLLPAVVNLFVAGLANLGPHIIGILALSCGGSGPVRRSSREGVA